jgi:simple sugar transport system permease protein
MYTGGISGVIGAFLYERTLGPGEVPNTIISIFLPLICALIGSALMSLVYCFLTITLRANQNVTGLAITTFGVGVGNFFGGYLAHFSTDGSTGVSITKVSKVFSTPLPFADKLGWFGTLFFSYGFLVYVGIILAVVLAVVLKRSRVGLHLRAVGENPATADAAGINVSAYKYGATVLGGMIAGLGGLYYVVDYMGVWSNDGFGDRGWLAIAIVIFTLWKPDLGILGSFLFGGLYIIYLFIPDLSRSSQELFKMLPYVVTIAVLVFTSIRNKRDSQPPASLGLPYFREER